MITTDELLEKLWLLYLEDRQTPEQIAGITETIKSNVGHKTYMTIENDISRIMDFYELQGFITGFKAGMRLIIDTV